MSKIDHTVTVKQCCDMHLSLAAHKHLRPSTIRQHSFLLDRYVIPVVGSLDINDLDFPMIERLLFETLSQGVSRETGYRTLIVFAAVLSFAESEGLVAAGAREDCRKIAREHRQRRPRPASQVVVPTYADLRIIEASATGKWPVVIRVFALTGLRGSEGCELTWDDVDFDRCFLRVRQTHRRIRDSIRIVPVPPNLMQMLADWKRDSAPNPANLVFPNRIGEMASPACLSAAFVRIQKAAGIVISHDGACENGGARCRHYPFTSLRRFCEQWCMYEVGLDSHQTARLLGRSTGRLADLFITPSIETWDLSRFAAAELKVFPDQCG